MIKQMITQWKTHLWARVASLCAGAGALVMAAIFAMSRGGIGYTIVSAPLLALSTGFISVVPVILAIGILYRLMIKPHSLLPMMTPLPSWQLLGSHLLVIIIDYVVASLLSIAIWSAFSGRFGAGGVDVLGKTVDALDTLKNLLVLVLSIVLVKSVFAEMKGRVFLGVLSFIGINIVLSLLNIFIIAFPGVNISWFGMTGTVYIDPASAAGNVAYVILWLAKIAGLFCTASWLMEKKMNV